jgi:hypothetical protein
MFKNHSLFLVVIVYMFKNYAVYLVVIIYTFKKHAICLFRVILKVKAIFPKLAACFYIFLR